MQKNSFLLWLIDWLGFNAVFKNFSVISPTHAFPGFLTPVHHTTNFPSNWLLFHRQKESWPSRDSNFQPLDWQPTSLPTELPGLLWTATWQNTPITIYIIFLYNTLQYNTGITVFHYMFHHSRHKTKPELRFQPVLHTLLKRKVNIQEVKIFHIV